MKQQDLSRWWLRLNDDREPTPAELAEQFDGLPPDPRTGQPVGFVSFAVELEARKAEQCEQARIREAMRPDSQVIEVGREFMERLRRQAQESVRRRG